jgi:peptide/nickel transport system permease protein
MGTFIGAFSGYFGGKVDDIIQRFTEFMITLPTLPLLLAFSALLRGIVIPGLPREWSSAVIISIILIAFGWTGSTRLVRGMVLSLRNQEFTEAARALGMGDIGIIIRHMIPNALAPIIVAATLDLGGVIIMESALSFLGFGIQPPIPTWGNMLSEYQNDMWTQPAKVFYPGLAIFICTLAFNYIGDGLRDKR